MRRILPFLYVGPAAHPPDVPRLKRSGVTAILSLQEPVRDLPEAAIDRMREACGKEIRYRNVAVRDYDPYDLIEHVPEILETLVDLQKNGRVIYLHCCEGVNRAPSAALAYLVRVEGMSVDEALVHLKSVDPVCRPYAEFVEWLRSE